MNKFNTKAAPASTPFEALKRSFEIAHANGGDYSTELEALAIAVARSVLNTCYDPQRTSAVRRRGVSDNGASPSIARARLDISAHERQGAARRELDGMTRTEIASSPAAADAEKALYHVKASSRQLDADIIQDVCLAILDAAAEYSALGVGWLDIPVETKRVKRRVYSSIPATVETGADNVPPIRTIYRAARRAVRDSGAVVAPENGRTYVRLDGMAESGELDGLYWRSGRWADIGGMDAAGNYTADLDGVERRESWLERLNLTAREMAIIQGREAGRTEAAICHALGISHMTYYRALARIREAAAANGLAPRGYDPAEKAGPAARPVERLDEKTGERVVYASTSAAARAIPGLYHSHISRAAQMGTRAGGYRWAYI